MGLLTAGFCFTRFISVGIFVSAPPPVAAAVVVVRFRLFDLDLTPKACL